MAKSFVCFQILAVTNITTEVSMIKIRDDDFVEVLEYDQNHISFEVDGRSCQPGHLVKTTGILHFPEGSITVVTLGKVNRCTLQANHKMKVTIELRSFDQEHWKRFTSIMDKRQTDLDAIFKLMRDAE